MRAEVDSPTYTGGLWRKDRAALVDPARLAWGLKAAAESLGVRIYEDTKATELEPRRRRRARHHAARPTSGPPGWRSARTPSSRCCAGSATTSRPVYDYCMVTEPLTAEQLASIGWANRQGLSRHPQPVPLLPLTEDNRILWGGYDAVYYWRGKVSAELESRPETWAKLSQHFFETFPQLEDVRFSHIWGGAIDTCSRFCVFWGTAMSGRVAYALGYTGLGVASTRFGAEVMLDLLDGRRTRGHVDRVRHATSRCRSRPSRSASPASRRPAGRSTARTAPASATSGCAPSTASASASTADARLVRVFAADASVFVRGRPARRHSDRHGRRAEDLDVGDDEHGVGLRRPSRASRRRCRPARRRRPSRARGPGSAKDDCSTRSAHSPPHQARSPGSANVHVELPTVRSSKPAAAHPRRQDAPGVGLGAVARRRARGTAPATVETGLGGAQRTRRSRCRGRRAARRVAAPGAHSTERRHRVGEVLQHLVGVDDVERAVGESRS